MTRTSYDGATRRAIFRNAYKCLPAVFLPLPRSGGEGRGEGAVFAFCFLRMSLGRSAPSP